MRRTVKRGLARVGGGGPRPGTTILIYHRVAGGTRDERDAPYAAFAAQVDALLAHRVVALDDALLELRADDDSPKVVVTFDDGFADVHRVAWPLLRDRSLPFTVYLATAYIGRDMHWEGSTASAPGPGLEWVQVREMVDTGLCTIGNHTHNHVRPDELSETELDRCSAEIRRHVGVEPLHFAYTWGIPVPTMQEALRSRFRSAVTGRIGRNHPNTDPCLLRRVPVRATDPEEFFVAKLTGRLLPEFLYAGIVAGAKRIGVPA